MFATASRPPAVFRVLSKHIDWGGGSCVNEFKDKVKAELCSRDPECIIHVTVLRKHAKLSTARGQDGRLLP